MQFSKSGWLADIFHSSTKVDVSGYTEESWNPVSIDKVGVGRDFSVKLR